MNNAEDNAAFEREVVRFAQAAVDQASERPNSHLDFTPDSLRVVEDLLAEASAYASRLSDPQKTHLTQSFGCYVLEVGRKQFGGSYFWHDHYDAPVLVVGEPLFHVALVTWPRVARRLTGDPADNIPFFYEGFAKRVTAQKPGDNVLFV